jgi:outer membrane lipoprotein carrier protein
LLSSRLLLAAACALGLSLSAIAPPAADAADGPATVDDLVSALQGRYKDISTLQAKFIQIQVSPVMGEVKSKGKVQVAKPRKARWETDGPQGSLFVTDGAKMSIYTPASNQVIQMNDMSQAGSGNVDILALLEDISKLDEQFEVTMRSDDPAAATSIVVDAKPRKPGGYASVRLEFDRKSLDLSRVVFIDSMGGTTDLRFSDLKLDVKIGADAFQFTPPAGVTVIDGGAM